MAAKKKRLTQREKAERARIKKKLQEDGVLPPDKPRLNRKEVAREVLAEFRGYGRIQRPTFIFAKRSAAWCRPI